MAFQVFDPCRPPVCFHEAQSLHLRYGPSVALPTLNSCRCLHEPKARFPVEWLFSLPGRELHPLEAPGLSWRPEVAAQVRIDHLAMAAVDQGVHLPDGVQTAAPRSVPILLRRQIGLENRTQDQHCRRLDHSVAHRRDAQRPLTSARLRDVDPANRLRSIPLLSELSRQFAQPCFPALRLDARDPRPVPPRRSAVGGASPGCLSGTACRRAGRSGSSAIPSLWRATPLAASGLFLEAPGSCHSPRLCLVSVVLEPRPLCSTGITRLPRYYGPLRHPKRPSLTLAGCRFSSRQETAGVSRVADAFLFHACRRHYPGGTPGLRRSSSARDSGLPQETGGSAPTLPFSRPARRSLSFRPACSPSRPRRPFTPEAPMASFPPPPLRLLPAGATSCRVGFAPTGKRPLCTAHGPPKAS